MKLFLDIDGVLVHGNPHRKVEQDEDGFYRFNPKSVDALQYLLKKYPIDEFILSSSHRFRFDLDEWLKIFARRGIFISKISRIETLMEPKTSRYHEIYQWIQYHKLSLDEFIILDDDSSLNALPSTIKKRLILTRPYVGLMKEDIENYLSQNQNR